MRRALLPHVPLAGVIPLVLVLLALPLQSCLEPLSVDCGPDLVCPAGQKCAANQHVCIKTDCGDGLVQESELCDDGNILDGDGCDSTCRSNEVCGNGIKDLGEVCDDGDNVREGGCSINCLSFETCGNGVADGKEECDNGGKDSARCNYNCTFPRCGDGYTNTMAGEQCDPQGHLETAECNFNCTLSRRGDGILNKASGEECDGAGVDTAFCDADGTLPRCGDGYTNGAAGEQCDTAGNSATCDSDCTPPERGDGIVNAAAGEECESGGIDTAFCDGDYTFPRCGDGHTNGAAGEQCDAAGESKNCNLDCTWARCGDGIVNATLGELCDDGNDDDCGTCNKTCTRAQRSEYAQGNIIISQSDSATLDGKWFSIDDGQHGPVVFEFDKDFTTMPGHIGIPVIISRSPGELAQFIKLTINGFLGLNITADDSDNIVRLENTVPGSIGNQKMTQSDTFAFTVDGMTGGASRETCGAGTGCRYDQDCASGSCQSGKCQ